MSGNIVPGVTHEDIVATSEWWKKVMPKWAATYFDNGAPNEAAADRAMDEQCRRSNAYVASLATRVTKDLSIADWEAAMQLETKRGHIAAVALARGGARNIRLADLESEP